MKTLLLWSGGLDSTASLLYWIKNKPEVAFDTLYVKLGNNDAKAKKEIEARDKIKMVIQDYLKRTFIDYSVIIDNVSLPYTYGAGKASMQPYLWIMGILMHMGNLGDEYDKVVFGYIREDDFWHFKTNVQEIILHGQEMAFNHRTIQFEYPMEWYTKYDIYHEFMRDDRVIREMIWTCENPILDKPCGACKPCKALDYVKQNINVSHDQIQTECLKLADSCKDVISCNPVST